MMFRKTTEKLSKTVIYAVNEIFMMSVCVINIDIKVNIKI